MTCFRNNKNKTLYLPLLLIFFLAFANSSCQTHTKDIQTKDNHEYNLKEPPFILEDPIREIRFRPTISDFWIGDENNRYNATRNREVTLFFDTFNGYEYAASENPLLTDTEWKLVSSGPPYNFTLSDNGGSVNNANTTKTVYLRVRDRQGLRSELKSTSIEYITRYRLTVAAGDAFNYAERRGFVFAPRNSECKISTLTGNGNINLLECRPQSNIFLGAKCDFKLFGQKKLRNGWVISSHRVEQWPLDGENSNQRGVKVEKQPNFETNDIEYNVHSWIERNTYWKPVFRIWTLELEGPVGKPWTDAFE